MLNKLVNGENSRIRIQDPDLNPDPLVIGMDPRIRIHPKMSWIRNTGLEDPPRHQMDSSNDPGHFYGGAADFFFTNVSKIVKYSPLSVP